MVDPATAHATAGGVPYGTGPGSVERELVAAIDRIAALEESVRQQEAALTKQAAELVRLERLRAEHPRYEEAPKMLLFELYGGSPANHPAWGSYRATQDFSRVWAQTCVASGLQVQALDRDNCGVATADYAKQMRFGSGVNSFTASADDIYTTTRNTEPWTLEELLILRRSFVVTMERLLGSRTEAGDYVPRAPKVRGRLLVTFENGVPGFADIPYEVDEAEE